MPLKEYQVVGRRLPSESEPHPKLYRMRLFAPNGVVARSRFFYFARLGINNLKKTTGEIVSCAEITERRPEQAATYGVWIRYNSRSATHNLYKEFRDTSRCGAVEQLYQDMAGRHRARWHSIHIVMVKQIKAADVRRPNVKQFIDPKIKFPLTHRAPRVTEKKFRKTFAPQRPTTFFG